MSSTLNTAGATNSGGVPVDTIVSVLSQDLRMQAQPHLRMAQMASVRTELQTAPGLTVRFYKWDDLSGSHLLTENVQMETNSATGAYTDITVGERGYKMAVTEKAIRASYVDLYSIHDRLLATHLARETDGEAQTALLTTSNVIYGGGKSAASSVTANDTLNYGLVQDLVEELAVKKAPYFDGDAYFMLIHPHQAKTLRADKNWRDVQSYANPTAPMFGEIGRIENVRFVETTRIRKILSTDGSIYRDNVDTGTNAGSYSSSANLYESIILGDNALGWAKSMEPELRDDPPVDLGRFHYFGYYGIWGFGLIESDHVIKVLTA